MAVRGELVRADRDGAERGEGAAKAGSKQGAQVGRRRKNLVDEDEQQRQDEGANRVDNENAPRKVPGPGRPGQPYRVAGEAADEAAGRDRTDAAPVDGWEAPR